MPSKVSRASITPQHYFVFQRSAKQETQSDPAYTAGSHKNPFHCGVLLIFMSACYSTNFVSLQNLLTANSVEMAGFEPATFALQRRCSPTEIHPQDLLGRVGLTGFEPVTPALSAQC